MQLPPALFYALGFVLVFFGVLRLIFLGLKAAEPTPEEKQAEEQEVRTEKRGTGLLGLMGGGRMTAAKRHKVMGVLWIILGLYVAWTGVTMSRSQQLARSVETPSGASGDRVRMIRANVKADPEQPSGGRPEHAEPPTLKAAPEPPAAE